MKKINSLLIIYALSNSISFFAMELVPLLEKKENIAKIIITIEKAQDIPLKLSFENIQPRFTLSSYKIENKNNIRLLESFPFYIIKRLPSPLPLKIITFMLDNDKEAAERFYRSPLYWACFRYNKAKKAVKELFSTIKPSVEKTTKINRKTKKTYTR